MMAVPLTARRQLRPFSFAMLSVLIGIVAGLGAVVFRGLIAFFHNLMFLGKFSLAYNANAHTPLSIWGPFVIFVPVVGALGVSFLIKNFAPEAKGHGVPEVMDAVYYNKGIIRPIVALIKSVASALSIGSGGSIGREGPIIQIGSSFGSTMGQILKIPGWQSITLIAAGAGGGIAATFNTPVGGVLFAIEIMLHEVSVKTLVPVAISTATATYIGRIFFGQHPSFIIPEFETPYFHITNPVVLFTYVGLGLITGLISALFIKSIYGFEDIFEKYIKGSYYLRHMSGMLLVGLLMYLFMVFFGHYYIEGVGYSTVQDVLSGALTQSYLLVLLFVFKLLATSLTLGSGASGGIFSPSLFMGATAGGAYGLLLNAIFPALNISPPAFAVAGMAGVVGGATGAAMAAIVMIFEMTLNYNVIIPMTITVALSYGVRTLISTESIYTLKLVRRGHYMPDALQTNLYFLKRARDIMESQFKKVAASMTLGEFTTQILMKNKAAQNFLVEDRNKIVGLITRDAALAAWRSFEENTKLKKITPKHYVTVTEDTKFLEVLTEMRSNQSSVAFVMPNSKTVAAKDVKGLITKERLTDFMSESTDMFTV